MRILTSLWSLIGLASAPFSPSKVTKAGFEFATSYSAPLPRRFRCRAVFGQPSHEANERRQAEGSKGHRTRQAKLALWSERCREINTDRRNQVLAACGLL